MFTDEMREFFKLPLIARIGTINPDGYPHAVPLWYEVDGDEVIFIAERKTKKVKNLLVNPKAVVTMGGDPPTAAYMITGDCTIEDDTDHAWTKRITYRYEDKEQAEKDLEAWKDFDMVVIRMKPKSVVKVF
jgi:PPOX class probable F420-dependent enzyme